jgi:hypothetical protein
MGTKNRIICGECHREWDKNKIERYCSNCFCCTGCERYICPVCDGVIVVVPVKKMNASPDSANQQE